MNETIKVLIVDDNPLNLKLLRVLLTTFGYEPYTAEDAEHALEVLKTLRPDLVLMDIELPGMSGLALTERLKATADFSQVPILALTANTTKGGEERALASGCDGYFAKPIDTRTFIAQIASFLVMSPGHENTAAGT